MILPPVHGGRLAADRPRTTCVCTPTPAGFPFTLAGMYTQCPDCRTVFSLDARVLAHERGASIAAPAIGGWLRQACASLGCRLPLVRDVHQLHLVARDVQAHPSVPGALMISATVRNDAPFAQPYPVVSLTLSDADGHHLAMRRLHPSEYLDGCR